MKKLLVLSTIFLLSAASLSAQYGSWQRPRIVSPYANSYPIFPFFHRFSYSSSRPYYPSYGYQSGYAFSGYDRYSCPPFEEGYVVGIEEEKNGEVSGVIINLSLETDRISVGNIGEVYMLPPPDDPDGPWKRVGEIEIREFAGPHHVTAQVIEGGDIITIGHIVRIDVPTY